jgi:hypothetical protein
MKALIALLCTLAVFSTHAEDGGRVLIAIAGESREGNISDRRLMEFILWGHQDSGKSLCYVGEVSEVKKLLEKLLKNQGLNGVSMRVRQVKKFMFHTPKDKELLFEINDNVSISGVSMMPCDD